MSTFGKVIVGMFRRFGTVISFGRREKKYTLPHQHLFEKMDADKNIKKESERTVERGEYPPLPKSSAKPANLRLIWDKDRDTPS
jgi:hypothetical protein